MKTRALAVPAAAAALLSVSACNKNDGSANSPPNAQAPKAAKAAGG